MYISQYKYKYSRRSPHISFCSQGHACGARHIAHCMHHFMRGVDALNGSCIDLPTSTNSGNETRYKYKDSQFYQTFNCTRYNNAMTLARLWPGRRAIEAKKAGCSGGCSHPVKSPPDSFGHAFDLLQGWC